MTTTPQTIPDKTEPSLITSAFSSIADIIGGFGQVAYTGVNATLEVQDLLTQYGSDTAKTSEKVANPKPNAAASLDFGNLLNNPAAVVAGVALLVAGILIVSR